MQDLNQAEPGSNGFKEELPVLSPVQDSLHRVSLNEIRATHEMLIGFREGVKEGTYQGKQLKYIAMGIEFLDNMVKQSAQNLAMASQREKEALKQAKSAIKQQGGQINESTSGS